MIKRGGLQLSCYDNKHGSGTFCDILCVSIFKHYLMIIIIIFIIIITYGSLGKLFQPHNVIIHIRYVCMCGSLHKINHEVSSHVLATWLLGTLARYIHFVRHFRVTSYGKVILNDNKCYPLTQQIWKQMIIARPIVHNNAFLAPKWCKVMLAI